MVFFPFGGINLELFEGEQLFSVDVNIIYRKQKVPCFIKKQRTEYIRGTTSIYRSLAENGLLKHSQPMPFLDRGKGICGDASAL